LQCNGVYKRRAGSYITPKLTQTKKIWSKSLKQIIVLATTNKGKTREINALLKGSPIEIKNLDDFGPIPEVIEDGETFDDNAYKKASFTAKVLGYPAMADDSGLCVEALDGAPGVYSARYAGNNATDADNVKKMLADLEGKENRNAAFKCVISIAVPTGAALTYEGECKGIITKEAFGDNGFGYDPLFFYPEFNKTFAQLTIKDKGQVSHRGKALKQIADETDKIIKWIDMNMPIFQPVECKGDHS
jgi:XTP/dITP diphosphohydrolase